MESLEASRHRSKLRLFLAAVAAAGAACLAVWLLRRGSPFVTRIGRSLKVADDASPGTERPDDAAEETVESPSDVAGEMPLSAIRDIGIGHAEQLAVLGLRTFNDLLAAGATPKGREELAAAVSVSGTFLLRWVNEVDLCRVDGVGPEYADLLEAAGVDTVPELARRRADNLSARMAEVNGEKGLVDRLPSEDEVAGWIASAKALPRVVTY